MKTSATAEALVEALQEIARNRPSDRNIVLLCQAGQRYVQDLEERLEALEHREGEHSVRSLADGATRDVRLQV
jgi:hypothetical protein